MSSGRGPQRRAVHAATTRGGTVNVKRAADVERRYGFAVRKKL
jgi:hypothetical protein